jgi:hypothetical protein
MNQKLIERNSYFHAFLTDCLAECEIWVRYSGVLERR